MRILTAILFAALALPASANFHLWYLNEIYSSADGTVQYVEFKAAASGQQFLRNHTIRSTSGSNTNTYTFPSDLPGDTAEGMDPGGYYGGYGSDITYKSFLVATQGFAAASSVTPDYIVPNGFLFPGGGTVVFGEGADVFTYGALPTDNRSLSRERTPLTPSPTNFAGVIGTVSGDTSTASYQGLWLNANELGWGINFTHQGTKLFATWFTYDTNGTGMWLVMSDSTQTSPGTYEGQLFRTTGPGFDSANFTPIGSSNYTTVGNLRATFSDSNTGSITYTVNGVTQTKSITRFLFSTPPTCRVGGVVPAGSATNYTDLWGKFDTEGGWGLNVVHQGDVLFATWFTYESGGTAAAPAKGLWLVMSSLARTGNGVYSGSMQRTTGPNAFSTTTPFNPNQVVGTTVGDATLTFTGANAGTFRYTVNGTTQTKAIQRLVYASPVTNCR